MSFLQIFKPRRVALLLLAATFATLLLAVPASAFITPDDGGGGGGGGGGGNTCTGTYDIEIDNKVYGWFTGKNRHHYVRVRNHSCTDTYVFFTAKVAANGHTNTYDDIQNPYGCIKEAASRRRCTPFVPAKETRYVPVGKLHSIVYTPVFSWATSPLWDSNNNNDDGDFDFWSSLGNAWFDYGNN